MATSSSPSHFPARHILVPIDFSEGSALAIQYAASLACKSAATTTLLHLIQLNIAGEEFGIPRLRFINGMVEAARPQLQVWLDFLSKQHVTAQTVVGIGPPHAEILKHARELQADLIIMTAHHRGGLWRWLRPDKVVRVIRRASCPVLVIPACPNPI